MTALMAMPTIRWTAPMAREPMSMTMGCFSGSMRLHSSACFRPSMSLSTGTASPNRLPKRKPKINVVMPQSFRSPAMYFMVPRSFRNFVASSPRTSRMTP